MKVMALVAFGVLAAILIRVGIMKSPPPAPSEPTRPGPELEPAPGDWPPDAITPHR